MSLTYTLGYPRIGINRELKRATESHWNQKIRTSELLQVAERIRETNWKLQKEAGIDLIPSNDFSFYDHILDHILTVGAIPSRYLRHDLNFSEPLDMYFAMARGYQKDGADVTAMEMTKWFDTNYHYIVPEFTKDQKFIFMNDKVIREFKQAFDLGIVTKPVLIGPISFLLLGKEKGKDFNRIDLLDNILPVYIEILNRLSQEGAEWVQLDEPFLSLDISGYIKQKYRDTYHKLAKAKHGLNIQVATYFESLRENVKVALDLPIESLHIDLVKGCDQIDTILSKIPQSLILSMGIVDGRNIWKNDYTKSLKLLNKVIKVLGIERVWIGPSCSLLHCPYDLRLEDDNHALPFEIKDWLSFSKQKLHEIHDLSRFVRFEHYDEDLRRKIKMNKISVNSRRTSSLVNDKSTEYRVETTSLECQRKSPFPIRKLKQKHILNLPLFPTSTIGSLPQTTEIRKWRFDYKAGRISEEEYCRKIKEEIKRSIQIQEEMKLDVLVHGEFERNDMVEYFGEQLKGFAFTKHGWIQSYGTRCVKPPIIYGDVSRSKEMTVSWTKYAQSLTNKPIKGIITGPVTMLQWSYVRDDIPNHETALQISLAISDEVKDLEKAGIRIIQVDEPAFREGLPLRKIDQKAYIEWAVRVFQIASSFVDDETQIHTHMCYSEFNDIVEAISQMDADVITIESSRSQMELLDCFLHYKYPNDIGPGVFDIHSPRIPIKEEIMSLILISMEVIPMEQIWVNPDCGLKTRTWEEAMASIKSMVEAAIEMRERVKTINV